MRISISRSTISSSASSSPPPPSKSYAWNFDHTGRSCSPKYSEASDSRRRMRPAKSSLSSFPVRSVNTCGASA